MTRFVGIDIGTTFLKGAVLDTQASTISHVQRVAVPPPVAGLAATRYEIDPVALLDAVRSLLDELLRADPSASGLVMCSQMHGLVFTDSRGRATSNVITWKDQRARESSLRGQATLFDELSKVVSPQEQAELGGEMRVGVPITALFALRQEERLPEGVYPASLPDFVLAQFCGIEPTTDSTLASSHGLFHVERNDWHRELISRLGFDQLRWPRIRRSGEVVGVASIGDRELTCFASIGDQQCALLGSGLAEGELSLNISTGSQISLLSSCLPPASTPSTPPSFQVRPYPGGRWLWTIVSVPAGRSLGLLVDLLAEIARAGDRPTADPWEYIRTTVDRIDTTDLEVDLSFFPSLTGGRGRIANIGEANLTVGHLFLGAFRAMAATYSRCAATLSPRRSWNRVVFSGGLAQHFPRLRREVLTALSDPPHRLCESEEDTLAGLLELARECRAWISATTGI